MNKPTLIILAFLWLLTSCRSDEQTTYCDVLVIGEGTGAVSAAIQSARTGAATILVNPLPWLGGMLTSAGVPATDGNHRMPAGLWGEFRQHLRDHYGGADSLFTGWVSNTQFEPHVGAGYWQQMADKESQLSIRKNALWSTIEKKDRWIITVILEGGKTEKIKARVLIDGTDLGDVAAAAGATYDLGMDARSESGESMAPESANDIVQDLTWSAILKDYGDSVDMTLPQPPDYNPSDFYCACHLATEEDDQPVDPDCGETTLHPCQTMLDYGKLPNGKYMINWPIHGNDYYANVSEMTPGDREIVYQKAKNHTLGFVYYIQTELGCKNLGLADDEFPTRDQLALMPYHREGRRIHGLTRMNINHLLTPYETPLYRTGIAVGDYPIDHHHYKNEKAPEIEFPNVPSFNVPIGCLIPKAIDDLLVADKAISVTNIVNGSSRLQPVIIQIGQVAGLMAALSVQENIPLKELAIRKVQQALLEANGYLLPFIDVSPEHPHFAAIHRIGATGILKGRGVPYKWANQTWFDKDTTLLVKTFYQNLKGFDGRFQINNFIGEKITDEYLSVDLAIEMVAIFARQTNTPTRFFGEDYDADRFTKEHWKKELRLDNYIKARPVTKTELAVLIDQTVDPFHMKSVNFKGEFPDNSN